MHMMSLYYWYISHFVTAPKSSHAILKSCYLIPSCQVCFPSPIFVFDRCASQLQKSHFACQKNGIFEHSRHRFLKWSQQPMATWVPQQPMAAFPIHLGSRVFHVPGLMEAILQKFPRRTVSWTHIWGWSSDPYKKRSNDLENWGF